MFLEKLMPRDGLYCVAQFLPKYGSFAHTFHNTLDAAARQLDSLSTAGNNVYLAQATFSPEKIRAAKEFNRNRLPEVARAKERSQDNALSLKSFFLDIDCGEKWPLKDQKEGCKALVEFIKEVGLPMPTVVNSGNGLYAHWVLNKAVPAPQWRTVAQVLKRVVAAYAPAVGGDASRTSDSASVLRPPGTMNRKPGKAEKPVYIIHEAPEMDFMQFARIIGAAAKRKKLDASKLSAPKPADDINAEFLVRQESAPSSPDKIADNCPQLEVMRSTKGDMTEPLWYVCLGLLAHCDGGEAVAQSWSSGHVDYSYGQTEGKIKQWLDAGIGPTTCSKFGEVNPNGCVGCRHNGQIKSPIVLGRPEPEQVVLPDEQCPPPVGFRRNEDGLFVEKDGRWVKFYDRDLWLHQLAYDESLGFEVMTIRHNLPHEGEMECTLRSSLVNDPKALLTAMSDQHIKVVGLSEKKIMVAYLESYQQTLQRKRRMTMLLCQMGWKTARNGRGPMFVLGKKIFHADGEVEDASLAKNVPRAALGFRSQGDLKKWVGMTSAFRAPGMEPMAFALLAGGFGSVLMNSTGFDGAVVAMTGESGAGKTLLLRMITSVWGYHKDLIMLKDDTRNTLISRLGVYSNLPLAVDEVTNMSGLDVSDFAYRITQGRDKGRLTQNAVEKAVLNTWNTLAVTSSNSSMIDLLSTAKQDPGAEINRILEYKVTEHASFKGAVATDAYWTLDEHFGLAGEVYAQWLVQNVDRIKPALDTVRSKIELAAKLRGDERFWGAVASVAIVGGLFAKQLGLIDFEIVPVYNWVIKTITGMRENKIEASGNSLDILGQFLSEHAHNRLVLTKMKGEGCVWSLLDEPRGGLAVRVELMENRMYIARSVVKSWIGKRYGSYNKIKTDLVKEGVVVDANFRRNLGMGTKFIGANQPCWKIDLTAPALAAVKEDLLTGVRLLDNTNLI